MSKKIQDILWGLFAVALVVVGALWILNSNLEHIDDTNGPENYSLNTITEENIINMDLGSLGGPNRHETSVNIAGINISSGQKYDSEKFTGVYELMSSYYFAPSDFTVFLSDFVVESGNFQMFVVIDGKIAATIDPSDTVDFVLEDIGGDLRLVIAGESADFRFTVLSIG